MSVDGEPSERRCYSVRNAIANLVTGSPYEGAIGTPEWWSQICACAPNVFALTSVLLSDSGAYRLVISPHAGCVWPPCDGWAERVLETAEMWWRSISGTGKRPGRLQELCRILSTALDAPLGAVAEAGCWDVCCAVLELHAIADEACAGFGIMPEERTSKRSKARSQYVVYQNDANSLLLETGSLALLSPNVIQVLPKLRTPQTGISLRSLSHHLAINRSEVTVRWAFPEGLCTADEERLNLLILPWPERLDTSAFRSVRDDRIKMDKERFGKFRYDPSAKLDIERYVGGAIEAASRRAGQVHGILFPEAALTETEATELRHYLMKKKVRFLLAGIRSDRSNCVLLDVYYRSEPRSYRQMKHHRWCIDESQIYQYHLGAALHPGKRWWEDIDVGKRELHFVTANGWLTLCHLICEDLARQDPVAQVIRSVGPTLVVALLLDGPQLGSRWPARYASVLADDPGSSVLTITSLGMALRCRPAGYPVSRCIGLWRDIKRGTHELVLDHDARALLLSLCSEWTTEWSADTRTDAGMSSHLVLSGVEQIRFSNQEETKLRRASLRSPRRPKGAGHARS